MPGVVVCYRRRKAWSHLGPRPPLPAPTFRGRVFNLPTTKACSIFTGARRYPNPSPPPAFGRDVLLFVDASRCCMFRIGEMACAKYGCETCEQESLTAWSILKRRMRAARPTTWCSGHARCVSVTSRCFPLERYTTTIWTRGIHTVCDFC